MSILAGENPFLEHAFLQELFHRIGNILEMLAGFVVDAALGVTSVIAGIAVAAACGGAADGIDPSRSVSSPRRRSKMRAR